MAPAHKMGGGSRATRDFVADFHSEDDSDDYDDLLFAERRRRGGEAGDGTLASSSLREDVM